MASGVMTMEPGKFYMLLVLSIVATAAGIYFFFRNDFRVRLIEDTPTSRVRSAAQGYVELIGHAEMMPGEPVVSGLTGQQCCWWRYKIEKETDNKWRTIESKTSDSPFFLEDQTGRCIIDPEGADVSPWEKTTWQGSTKYPARELIGGGVDLTIAGLKLDGGQYRYTEELIVSGNPLYALGHFRSLDELDHRESRSEIMRSLLNEWKSDKATLLARFDTNNDGQIDQQEWEHARMEAKAIADAEHHEMQKNIVPHILSKPKTRGQPFIIATKDQAELTKSLKWWSYGFIALGTIGFSTFIFLLASRFISG